MAKLFQASSQGLVFTSQVAYGDTSYSVMLSGWLLEMRAEKQPLWLQCTSMKCMCVLFLAFLCLSFALEIPILPGPEAFVSDYQAWDIRDNKEEQCD